MSTIYNYYKNYIQPSEATKAYKDFAEFTVELLDVAWEFKLIQKLPPVAHFVEVIETGLLIYKAINKPVKVIKAGIDVRSGTKGSLHTAVKVAAIVKDSFKWIAALQALGLLPANVYAMVGLGALAPNIWLIIAGCSIATSAMKAMKAWHSIDDLRQQKLDELQLNLNQDPAHVQQIAKQQCQELRDQVQAAYSASAPPSISPSPSPSNAIIPIPRPSSSPSPSPSNAINRPEQNKNAWDRWNRCFADLNLILDDKTNHPEKALSMLMIDIQEWISIYGDLAVNDPVVTMEKESLEFGLIYLLSRFIEMTKDEKEKKLCRAKMQGLLEWKENRIYRSRFQWLKQGIDITAGAVAIALMLRADRDFDIFNRYTLFKKGVAVFGHVVSWFKPV